MTISRPRLWLARLALLAGGVLMLIRLAAYRSFTGAVLGRYSLKYLLLWSVILIGVALLLIALTHRRTLAALTHGGESLKLRLLAGWFPALVLFYVAGWLVMPDPLLWNHAFPPFLIGAAVAVAALAGDALPALLRRPEIRLVVGSLIVTLLLLEGGLRLWLGTVATPEQQAIYSAPITLHPQRFLPQAYGYKLNPAAWDGDVNSAGFRGPEIAVPKPDGVYRIVTLGGSTTFGSGIDRWQDAYPAQLERILREEYGYPQVEVINAGVGDYTSFESLIHLSFRVVDLQPDLIILYQNINDVQTRIVAPATYTGDNSGMRQPWNAALFDRVTGWQNRIPSVVWRVVAIQFRWIRRDITIQDMTRVPCSGVLANEACLGMPVADALMQNPPDYYARNLRSLIGVSQAHGADFLMLTWASNPTMPDAFVQSPVYQDAFAEQNAIALAVAADMGVYSYDFAADMPLDHAYWLEGVHLSAEGAAVQASLIAAAIDQQGIIPPP